MRFRSFLYREAGPKISELFRFQFGLMRYREVFYTNNFSVSVNVATPVANRYRMSSGLHNKNASELEVT